MLGWVFFRADDLTSGVRFLAAMAGLNGLTTIAAAPATHQGERQAQEQKRWVEGVYAVAGATDEHAPAKPPWSPG